MMIEGQEPTGVIAIRPCRAEECEAVLALWRRAGATASATDTLEELLRLVRSEHGDGFLVAVQAGAIVGSVIGGGGGGGGENFSLGVGPGGGGPRPSGGARRRGRGGALGKGGPPPVGPGGGAPAPAP